MTNITVREKTLIYELLGLFQGGTYDWYTFNDWTTGEIASVPICEQVNFTTAISRLEVIITIINTTDSTIGRRARISEVLEKYDEIALEKTKVVEGGMGGMAGMRYSTDSHREHLRLTLNGLLGIRVEVANAGVRWPWQGGSGNGSGGGSIEVSR